MSQAHERYHAQDGSRCRFCGSPLGAIFMVPTGVNYGFHLDCLIPSWQRGEERVQIALKLEEQVRAVQAENEQLKVALRNRTPGGSVAGFGDNLRRASQQTAPTPPKPTPVAPKPAPKPAPEPEKPRPDRFSLIDLD